MDRESEKVQGDEHGCKVHVAMAEIVFEIVSFRLQSIESFVFDFPSGSPTCNEFDDIIAVDGQICNETVAVSDLAVWIADLN